MNRGLAIATLTLGVLLALFLSVCAPQPSPPAPAPGLPPAVETPRPSPPPTPPTLPPRAEGEDCRGPRHYAAAASENRANLHLISWAPFGRGERGWATYAPFVGRTVGTDCGPETPRFAEVLASWERRNGLSGDGVLDSAAFLRMKNAAHALRPFVALRSQGICPNAPRESLLVTAGPNEGYKGKAVQMRPAVLRAYRRMVADARAASPEIARDPDMLDIFSAYRSPAYDAARCARDGNCQGITRASCSPHRTGLALDIVVGSAPGQSVDSTADDNRRAMSQTAAYKWLVKNAHRYGFVNYVFEPWHWEYVEEPV